MARIEQLMAEAESITAGETDDEILLRASELLAKHRRMLADVEEKLKDGGQMKLLGNGSSIGTC